MKLEAGEFYVTRDGHKAYVLGTYPDDIVTGQSNRKVSGMVQSFENDKFYSSTWTIEGFCSTYSSTDYDLVGPWVEPRKPIVIEKWAVVNAHSGDCKGYFDTLDFAEIRVKDLSFRFAPEEFIVVKITGSEEIK